jgi:hypothetical protein
LPKFVKAIQGKNDVWKIREDGVASGSHWMMNL